MDEIIIEEKKYVSSKQAAKITGYAKDYIGQLCREGRVPARLVGRSWYVLESAIQDHRFGAPELSEEAPSEPASAPEPVISTRYEPVETPVLPSINRLREDVAIMHGEQQSEEIPESQDLRDAWSNWFNELPTQEEKGAAPSSAMTEEFEPMEMASEPAQVPAQVVETVDEAEFVQEDKEESISIHILNNQSQYRPMLETLTPQREESSIEPAQVPSRKRNLKADRTVRTVAVVMAVSSIVLAALGTGYFDEYLVSDSRAAYLGGISIYNK